MVKDRKQEAIDKANKVHNFKYDYSLIEEYLNNKIHYPVICHKKDSEGNEHGAFSTTFSRHVNRQQGCPKCKSEHLRQLFSLSKEEFIKRCETLFGDKYIFDKTEYINMDTEVIITCPIHGDFKITPHQFLKSLGCKECSKENNKIQEKLSLKEIKDKLDAKHNGNISFVGTQYKGIDALATFYCNKHQTEYSTTTYNAVKGVGCPQCQTESRQQKTFIGREELIKRAIKIHGNKYSFEKLIYNGRKHTGIITCPIHGDFEIILENLLKGHGCSKCSQSLGEALVESKLVENNINFQTQASFSFLKNKQGKKSLDFYLPDYNVAIEYQGAQHFVPIRYFGGQEHLKQQIERDKIKYQLCKDNNIDIFYIVKKEDYNKTQKLDIYCKENTFSSIDECINVIKCRLNSK